ncbi:unnamed protein product, partial [Phaeothamnion confervicola]
MMQRDEYLVKALDLNNDAEIWNVTVAHFSALGPLAANRRDPRVAESALTRLKDPIASTGGGAGRVGGGVHSGSALPPVGGAAAADFPRLEIYDEEPGLGHGRGCTWLVARHPATRLLLWRRRLTAQATSLYGVDGDAWTTLKVQEIPPPPQPSGEGGMPLVPAAGSYADGSYVDGSGGAELVVVGTLDDGEDKALTIIPLKGEDGGVVCPATSAAVGWCSGGGNELVSGEDRRPTVLGQSLVSADTRILRRDGGRGGGDGGSGGRLQVASVDGQFYVTSWLDRGGLPQVRRRGAAGVAAIAGSDGDGGNRFPHALGGVPARARPGREAASAIGAIGGGGDGGGSSSGGGDDGKVVLSLTWERLVMALTAVAVAMVAVAVAAYKYAAHVVWLRRETRGAIRRASSTLFGMPSAADLNALGGGDGGGGAGGNRRLDSPRAVLRRVSEGTEHDAEREREQRDSTAAAAPATGRTVSEPGRGGGNGGGAALRTPTESPRLSPLAAATSGSGASPMDSPLPPGMGSFGLGLPRVLSEPVFDASGSHEGGSAATSRIVARSLMNAMHPLLVRRQQGRSTPVAAGSSAAGAAAATAGATAVAVMRLTAGTVGA